MGKYTIKYQYALTLSGQPVHISELTHKDRDDYTCPGCKKVLRPILGQIRQKYFRHKVDSDCSRETYLHRIGKDLFKKYYTYALKNGKPFEITYFVPIFCNACPHGHCQIGKTARTWDLTKAFTSIELETSDDNFKPDLLLKTTNGEKIYIEIAVTHKSEDSKIKSKTRIIEFQIQDENDLALLTWNHISADDDRIHLFNFKPPPIKRDCRHKCNKLVYYFMVHKSGKCILNSDYQYPFDQFVSKVKPLYISIVDQDYPETFISEVQKAFFKKIKIKNCFLCRYHACNKYYHDTKPIFCKFYKQTKGSNAAYDCPIYRPDPKAFDEIGYP
jgi:hypothetical protein